MSGSTKDATGQAGLCRKCQEYLPFIDRGDCDHGAETKKGCPVCLDLWQISSTREKNDEQEIQSSLHADLIKACEPYGGLSKNRFSSLPNHTPTVSLAGDIAYRYRQFASRQPKLNPSSSASTPPTPFQFCQDLKHHLQNEMQSLIQNAATAPSILSNDEEQGYLSVHLLCIPPHGQSLQDCRQSSGQDFQDNRKRKRARNKPKPFVSQGGDPRIHLEERLRQQHGYQWWTIQEALDQSQPEGDSGVLPPAISMEFHVAVFRRPIYLYGYYTKSRRDVSQTPFVVQDKRSDKNGGMEAPTTLGATSVEEQICQPIIEMLGVSDLNHMPPPPAKNHGRQSSSKEVEENTNMESLKDNKSEGENSASAPTTVYGMCKFHASGREDMDVRMILRPRPGSEAASHSSSSKGRPFCVQIVDALRPLESQEQLQEIVRRINKESDENSAEHASPLWYGMNPMGVGISSDFRLVTASHYSGLQEDTESKVKHYGCHCWSEKELPEGWKLELSCPLTIRQRTPLRVLHRRSNLVRERELPRAVATRVDDHHYRLELSTQAGTYVKEFVHGDLGRTNPNMGTFLGCKTNLLLLDCEGIEMGEDDGATK